MKVRQALAKKKENWTIQRQSVETSDAITRWDRVYQCLLQVTIEPISINPVGEIEIKTGLVQNIKQEVNLCG